MRLSVVVEPGPSARSSSSLAGAPCHVGEPWSHAHAHAHVASAAASADALCLSVCKVWVSTRRGGRRYEGKGDLLTRAASYAGWRRGEVPELVQRGVAVVARLARVTIVPDVEQVVVAAAGELRAGGRPFEAADLLRVPLERADLVPLLAHVVVDDG